ncbi:MAG TPA: SPOR domain-containing protein [Thermoanaerobaculia bacterium]|nr:SPOR domain-containing protein [Thermoanaerobaculia bacterium]
MSDSHEPSYYEIALTNRQVVVAFVILLVCLMGTFFSGVWVGRGEASGSPPEPQRQAVADDAGGAEPLDFFGGGEDDEAPAAEPRAAQRRPDRGSDEEAAGGEGAALPAGAPTAARNDPPPAAPSQPAQQPRTEPAQQPEPQRQAAADPPSRQQPAARQNSGGPVVQVFSSNDRDQAERTLERLQDAGQPAFLSPVEVDGQTMYRVRIGPFSDRAAAEKVADDVRRRYRLDTWITQ